MKKTIITVLLGLSMISPSVIYAQTVTPEQVRQELITLLTTLIAQLQAQINEILAQQNGIIQPVTQVKTNQMTEQTLGSQIQIVLGEQVNTPDGRKNIPINISGSYVSGIARIKGKFGDQGKLITPNNLPEDVSFSNLPIDTYEYSIKLYSEKDLNGTLVAEQTGTVEVK